MDGNGSTHNEHGADDIAFEVTSLRVGSRHARAYTAPDAPEAIRFFAPAPRWLRHTATLLLACLLLLCAMSGSASRGRLGSLIPGNPATLLPASFGYGCVRDLAWDPRQPRLALLLSCERQESGRMGRGMLVLWQVDARGSSALRRIALDPLVDTAQDTDTSATEVAYQHLVWSGDGGELAVTFATGSQAGLLLLSPDGVLLHRLLAPRPALAPEPPAPVADGMALLRWDIARGSLGTCWLPRAASYAWQGDGLAAVPAFAESTASLGDSPLPVGNPAGGATFAVWQPGVLLRGANELGSARWTTYPFAAWSPDRTVLLLPLYASVPFAVAVVSNPALGAIVKTPGTHFVAWRPDGGRVASFTAGGGAVTVRDGLTGNLVAGLHPRALANAAPIGSVSDVVLAWSPDGSRLALLDARRGAVDVWLLG